MSLINFTQFVNTYFAGWPDTVTDPTVSRWYQSFSYETRYGVQKRKVEEVALNSGASYTLGLSGLAQGDWVTFMISCFGEGYITLSEKDAAGSAITGKLEVYGCAPLPGILFLSTTNLQAAPIITSLQDGSVFEIFEATCLPDGS